LAPAAPEAAPGAEDVLRIVAPNPGPMTLDGTNTYVAASAEGAYVIDPGPADPGHLDAIAAAAEPHGGIAGVLLTHSHSDHSAGAGALGAPILWGAISSGDEAHALAASAGGTASPAELHTVPVGAEMAPSRVGSFSIVPTPGHATDHVCFVRGRICFCGDLVLGRGSSIVPPRAGGGSLAEYMASLKRLADLDATLLAPGHGPWIADPAAKIAEYTSHRLGRERRLVAALESGERSRSRLLAIVWDDVPELLRPAAAIAMQAHLEKLEDEGALEGIELSGD
jgi:glyoxylase-like metal-dependent hydrolase (beta-lactamase superfamily II)